MARPLLAPRAIREKVDCYLNADEYQHILANAQKCRLSLSAYIRNSAMNKKIVYLPQGNLKNWQALANLQGLLNQLCHGINSGVATGVDIALVEALLDEVVALRLDLMRASDDDSHHDC